MQAIFEIDSSRRTPKYLQIAHSVTKAIKQGKIKRGDRILSINELSNEFLLSRDTVQKAYGMLEKEKIIHAVRGKGFYINRTDIASPLRILLVFNELSSNKKMIYDGFVKTLDCNGTVDLDIHHSNIKLLDEIIRSSLGEYDYYLVMPYFPDRHETVAAILKQIPKEKLILLDRLVPDKFLHSAAIYQDFENDIREALEEGLDELKKYDTLVYVNPLLMPRPAETVKGFVNFCNKYKFENKIIDEISLPFDVQPGHVYLVVEDTDLINLIKSIQQRGLIVGKDIGIISYNESPMKEVLLNGITTISIDHYQMGKMAAELILDQKLERIKNPFRFIKRGSL